MLPGEEAAKKQQHLSMFGNVCSFCLCHRCQQKERVIHLTFIGVRRRARKLQMGRYLLSVSSVSCFYPGMAVGCCIVCIRRLLGFWDCLEGGGEGGEGRHRGEGGCVSVFRSPLLFQDCVCVG